MRYVGCQEMVNVVLVSTMWLSQAKVSSQNGETDSLLQAVGFRADDPHVRCHQAPMRGRDCHHVLFIYNKFDRAWRCECSYTARPSEFLEDFVMFSLENDT